MPRARQRHHAVDHPAPAGYQQNDRHHHTQRLCPVRQGGVVQMVRTGPDIQGDQCPEMHDGQTIGVDRALGLLGHEVIHHAEKTGGQEKTDGVVSVPPLDHGVGRAGIRRIGFEQADRQRDMVDDVQHAGHHDECAVEPVGDIDMPGAAFDDGAEKHRSVGGPYNGQQNRHRPFELGIFLGGGIAHRQRHDGADDHRLPAPEGEGCKTIGNQPCLAGALHHVIRGGEQRAAAEGKDHQIGVQRAQAAEGGPFKFQVQPWPDQLRCDEHAQAHADHAPDHGHDGELAHHCVVVGCRSDGCAHCRFPRFRGLPQT